MPQSLNSVALICGLRAEFLVTVMIMMALMVVLVMNRMVVFF